MDKEFKVNNELKKILRMVLAFSIPVFILGFVYYRLGIIPFGDNSLLTIDLKNQYISYFSYLKNSLLGNDSLLYSFSKTLSGNMTGLVGYYLISPFNVLFLFANVSNFTIILTIITLCKTGAAALTMYIYLKSKDIDVVAMFILSTSYALSGYMVIYQQNIMWLDAVILLPLVILGIDNLFRKKQTYIYIISFSLLMITNYYIGFMVVIFVVFYFLASMVEFLYNKEMGFKDILFMVRNFLVSSLVAGGISSIIWLPSVLSYGGSSKMSFDFSELIDMHANFTITEFLSKLVVGSTNRSQIISGLPNIYITSSLIILGILFFMNSTLNTGVKIKYGLLISIMYISFKYVGLNIIWHGFSEPNWFPYRNSFIFIFLIVSIAGIQLKNFSISFSKMAFILVISIFAYIDVKNSEFDYIPEENIKITFIAILIAITLLSLAINKRIKLQYVLGSILILTVFEVESNSYLTLEENNYYDANEYNNFVLETEPIMNEYKPKDNEFYRIEKTFSYSQNDALLLNYPGLSHYSSNEIDSVKEFLGNMGYRNYGSWSIYANGSSWLADSLLGVKYIVSDDNPKNYLNIIHTNDETNVYYNPYAFPLGFLTDQPTDKKVIENNNTFEYQNEFINSIFETENIYQKIPKENIKVDVVNLEYNRDGNNHVFSQKNTEEEAYILLNVTGLTEENQLNIFLMNDELNNPGYIYIDDQYQGKTLDLYENNIYSYQPQYEEVEIKIKLKNDVLIFNQALLYANEISQIEKIYSLAESRKLKITDFSPTNIIGEVPSRESDSQLVLTIPYDDGWHASVDGNEVETFKINDVLLGIEIPKNSKSIELKYIPKGLYLSIIISLISLGSFGYILKNKNN